MRRLPDLKHSHPPLLVLSNGHGEDEVAVRILKAFKQLQPNSRVMALPMVGVGQAYQVQNIPLLMTGQTLPSGGFLGPGLWRDLRSGLLRLMGQQIRAVRQWSRTGGVILAVGDIVPLLVAVGSGRPFAFIGTAKSDYGRVGGLWRQSIYWPWERWLMSQAQCRGVFPRDRITATTLQRWSIPVFDCGNPMMDDLEPPADSPLSQLPAGLKIVLLPGSHSPEVFANWRLLLSAMGGVMEAPQPYVFLGAISPGITLLPLQKTLRDQGWTPDGAALRPSYQQQHHKLCLIQNGFKECLDHADLVMAMAGTATEQAVGLGKPVITLPGPGPQFTPQFAAAQARLLGPSIFLMKGPQDLSQTLSKILDPLPESQQWIENGWGRMGGPGASDRIAHSLKTHLYRIESD